jgi:ArsR family transcriptional regulator
MDPENFFKQLSDVTRMRCLALLASEGELCVCELTYALELSQPKISRHLAQMREAEIVNSRKQGQWVYYRINTGLPGWQSKIISEFRSGVHATEPYKSDIEILRGMPNRPGSSCCA